MTDDGLDVSNYGVTNLVDNWADFIDWQKRQAADGQWLLSVLAQYKDPAILDVCVGDGCDAIFLLQHGFNVVGNEVDQTFKAKALANAKKEGVRLELTSTDWRELSKSYAPASLDVITCTGNSLTYLFGAEHQLATLREFKKLLKPGGILIVDERNYQYMLDNRDEILQGKFRYKGANTYRGQYVHGRPVSITDDKITVEYSHDESGILGRLSFYPYKKGELRSLLQEAGFIDIQQWGDYEPGDDRDSDFFEYVARNPKAN